MMRPRAPMTKTERYAVIAMVIGIVLVLAFVFQLTMEQR